MTMMSTFVYEINIHIIVGLISTIIVGLISALAYVSWKYHQLKIDSSAKIQALEVKLQREQIDSNAKIRVLEVKLQREQEINTTYNSLLLGGFDHNNQNNDNNNDNNNGNISHYDDGTSASVARRKAPTPPPPSPPTTASTTTLGTRDRGETTGTNIIDNISELPFIQQQQADFGGTGIEVGYDHMSPRSLFATEDGGTAVKTNPYETP